ncbi:4Fe-4S dicluster domain-containing protein [Magnetococcales bacterium HHB-1]
MKKFSLPRFRLQWPRLRTLRQIYAIFFFTLFLFLLFMADAGRLQGYAVSWLLEIDPLTGLAAFLTSGTVYKGLIWGLIIFIPTLFLGRFFCSWICPLGILNQFFSFIFNHRKAAEASRINAYRPIFRIKYYLLAALLLAALFGTLQIGLLDPIALTTRAFALTLFPALQHLGLPLSIQQPIFHGGILIALLFVAIILANRLLTRFWCRTLCPLGALLGLFSKASLFRIRRNVDLCTDCNQCQRHCQGGCDPQAELRISECHVCMNCIEQCPEQALHYGLPESRSSIHKPLDIHKRRLVESSLIGATLFPLLRVSKSAANSAESPVIRPPGSLTETDFLARCIKCAACMKVCPTNVLQPTLLESGLEGLWTPILINKLGYCEHHCVLCGQVCPTGAIEAISIKQKVGDPSTKTPPLKLGTAFYDRGRCLPWAMQIPCIVCEEVCPTSPKAIWYRKKEVTLRDGSKKTLKQPFVDPARCIGCGICENKCPVKDLAAIRVTAIGESRTPANRMLLKKRNLL